MTWNLLYCVFSPLCALFSMLSRLGTFLLSTLLFTYVFSIYSRLSRSPEVGDQLVAVVGGQLVSGRLVVDNWMSAIL